MKYTYREFAKRSHTTIRTLRYYENIGLITPLLLHEQKYLEDTMFIKLQTIQLLKNAGYSLEEIKQVIKDKNIEEHIIMQKDVLHIQLTNIKSMLSLIDTLQNNKSVSNQETYAKFLQIQNKQNLQLQFETPNDLQTRILFHHTHTRFKNNFHEWMFDHYTFLPMAKVLEVGCGEGILWKCNIKNIPKDIEITMTDVSLKMLEACQEQLAMVEQIKKYEYADCFCLPYPNESFDQVIANHVFMYFEDLDSALQEIHRVLKKGGVLYCSTIAKDMMKERDVLLSGFDSKISFDQDILYTRFGYENGKEKLNQYFEKIELFDRKEVYEVTDIELYYRFIMSGKGLSANLEPLYRKKKHFYQYLKECFKKDKLLYVTVHAGMFKAIKGE